MEKPDSDLWKLVRHIIAGDDVSVRTLLVASPSLARACFREGASRGTSKEYFLDEIGRYVIKGDTALHFAAAAYEGEIARVLIEAGADVRARNRLGDEPLHSAAVGAPDSRKWNPEAQAATIIALVEAGADPNAMDKIGVAPLHRAVRTRCAAAVKTLIKCGANATLKNKRGSTPMLLATLNTGKSGSGSEAAKAQQREIVKMLREIDGSADGRH